MSLHDDLKHLQDAAVVIAAQTDRKLRHKGGMWLDSECRKFEETYRPFDGIVLPQVEVDFRAVIKILVDYILYDALEDMDWAAAMPDHFEGDLQEILKGK